MKFIVGLGNPGPKYLLTRHNIGFMLIDMMADRIKLSYKSKWDSEYIRTKIKDEDVVLQKPLTYMNLSGQSVQPCLSFFKGEPSDLLVVQDDVSMPFGAIRLQKNRSAGGHNGIKDITNRLGTQDYARLKIGVGEPNGKQSMVDYVLSNFSKEEQQKLPDLLIDCEFAVVTFIEEGLDKAANKHNRKQWNT
jgi:PTH1 family peptidyl-tRNA hydrolase